ncbi:MAG: ABC transporter ATP-binding protein [Fimbriiglobus sp.]|nr:ABC transporter ATP-binding protein [Fimbriiglobus sp.]
MITAERLSKTYGSGTSAVPALSDVNFTIAAGERVAILGKSGSGKSTLMNIIGGLDTATNGTLTVAGQHLATLSRRQLADFRLGCIGFIFQSFHLIPSQTVEENVTLPLVLAKVGAGERRRRVQEMLEAVGLGHRIGHRPTQLSGGERQRAAVARALINEPAVLLADEPTGNLDSANATSVMELLLTQVQTRGMTLLLVTHDEELARRHTGRVIRMCDGRVEVN